MEPKVNLWIEIDDQVVLSRWRVELLAAIAETGSISGAADRMGVPIIVNSHKDATVRQIISTAVDALGHDLGGGRGKKDTARAAKHA